jgi:hypothetical protein
MIITTYQLSAFAQALHGTLASNPNTSIGYLQKTIVSFLPDQRNAISESTPGENFFVLSDNCSIDTYNKPQNYAI